VIIANSFANQTPPSIIRPPAKRGNRGASGAAATDERQRARVQRAVRRLEEARRGERRLPIDRPSAGEAREPELAVVRTAARLADATERQALVREMPERIVRSRFALVPHQG
jgi:hypothetical protein